jgi:hypothetical protein
MASPVKARTLSVPVFRDPVLTVVTSRDPAFLRATPRASVIAVTGSFRRRHQTHIRGLPTHLLPRHANCQALRPDAPETPPFPPTARQSGRLDLDERDSGAGTLARGLPSSVMARREGRLQKVFTPTLHSHMNPGHRAAGQSKRARSGPLTHGSITGSDPSNCILLQPPQVRSSLASLSSATGSAARAGVDSRMGRTTRRRPRRRRQPRYVQVQPLAQVQRRLIKRQLPHGDPQVQGVAAGTAAETVPALPLQVGGKRAAARRP